MLGLRACGSVIQGFGVLGSGKQEFALFGEGVWFKFKACYAVFDSVLHVVAAGALHLAL